VRSIKPIICTLTARDRKRRGDRWLDVLRSAAAGVQPLPDGVAIRIACDDATLQTLRELMKLEAACCEWMLLDLHEDALGATLAMRAESAAGVAVIRTWSAKLSEKST
jgi:hypothetical protein